eukprot:m.107643 g.107643  ORF g.107643 m.107643 type:complete len:547 (-) comp15860_c0_seq1:305-1945(-)
MAPDAVLCVGLVLSLVAAVTCILNGHLHRDSTGTAATDETAWPPLEDNARVLVVGAENLLGYHVALSLARDGHAVHTTRSLAESQTPLHWDGREALDQQHRLRTVPALLDSNISLAEHTRQHEWTHAIVADELLQDSFDGDAADATAVALDNLVYLLEALKVSATTRKPPAIVLVGYQDLKADDVEHVDDLEADICDSEGVVATNTHAGATRVAQQLVLDAYHHLYGLASTSVHVATLSSSAFHAAAADARVRPVVAAVTSELAHGSHGRCHGIVLQPMDATIEPQETVACESSCWVFTSYFTSSADPQRAKQRSANRFAYMRAWYNSLKALGMHAVVFHDGLGTEFMKAIEGEGHVTFHHVALANRSTNDARFFAYRDYLATHPAIHRVLLTDISDVRFQHDPFLLMSVFGNLLYIGKDVPLFNTMEEMGWMQRRVKSCFLGPSNGRTVGQPGQRLGKNKISTLMATPPVYNAGVIGGYRDLMLEFLGLVTAALDTTPHEVNCNMAVVNMVAQEHFGHRVFAGSPLTSRFMQRQSEPRGVFIVHK